MSKLNDNISNLPNEINYGIMLTLPLTSLLNLCETNKFNNDLWNDEYFWRRKCYYDFGERADYNPKGLDWKSLYIYLYISKDIPICIIYEGIDFDINSCDKMDKIRIYKTRP